MKIFRTLGVASAILAASATIASAQEPAGKWLKLTHQPTFQTDIALLLTDGSAMVHEYMSPNWYRLIPSNTASYLNGTWVKTASMPSNYGPLYFASQVLPDGRLLVEGGEYNIDGSSETNRGAIYDPVADKWTAVNPPSGWRTIGDSPAVVLPNGTLMMGQGGQPAKLQVEFNASSLTWTPVGTGKADGFSEEGFALLPNGNVLTVDTENGTNSETFNPSTNAWSTAGSTVVALPSNGGLGIVPEMGPLMQRPDGTVVALGATTHTSVYKSSTGTWAQGPDYPGGNMMGDAPASLLPDGNVLVMTSPFFNSPSTFYEFNGTTFTTEPGPASAPTQPSFTGRLLVLPTGQILYTAADGATIDAELYSSNGTIQSAWRPTITSVPSTVTHGNSYTVTGTQLNGLSAANAYGDDAQNASNYPLVAIQNKGTKHIAFARTTGFSTMGIATGSTPVSATFAVPATIETGASTLYVVTNGILSGGKAITVN